ncbi:hypothetical protein [Pseudoxanthomonas koreensis]|uniref:hypothetical protein n=1 Tax=Pseudoxanthomonas koreensis TaxID=266061 RepID=UPI001390E03D|nr:hypothetical protein [Pseudoxanthomonas koreensis]KAF1691027.1 hypothetical protein CSC64_10580 [Pseudoxanthomonas koreensis]
MTTAPDIDPRDRNARQLHAAALAPTSPRTLARLREARREAAAADARPRRPALATWLAGGAVAAALGLAVVLGPGLPTSAPAPGTPAPMTASVPAGPGAADAGADAAFAAAAGADLTGPLQEDPGFYVWLDSVDANALAME